MIYDIITVSVLPHRAFEGQRDLHRCVGITMGTGVEDGCGGGNGWFISHFVPNIFCMKSLSALSVKGCTQVGPTELICAGTKMS
jgi:hypothetical protein